MSLQALPLFPGVPGGTELAVILLIAVLLFGANKIPKLARSTGEAMGEFKKGREQVERELEEIRDGPQIDDSEAEEEVAEEPDESEAESESESTEQ